MGTTRAVLRQSGKTPEVNEELIIETRVEIAPSGREERIRTDRPSIPAECLFLNVERICLISLLSVGVKKNEGGRIEVTR